MAKQSIGHRWLSRLPLIITLLGVAADAQARDSIDCEVTWSRVARSYLSSVRAAKSGPNGEVIEDPTVRDEAWQALFRPACQMAQNGQRSEARVEAAAAAVLALSALEAGACQRFAKFYLGIADTAFCKNAQPDRAELQAILRKALPRR